MAVRMDQGKTIYGHMPTCGPYLVIVFRHIPRVFWAASLHLNICVDPQS